MSPGRTEREWWAWVDLNHRPRPYQASTVRFHNNLQDRGDCHNTCKSHKTSHLWVELWVDNLGLGWQLTVTAYPTCCAPHLRFYARRALNFRGSPSVNSR